MFKKRIKRVLAIILVFISAGIIFLERCKPKDSESPLPVAGYKQFASGQSCKSCHGGGSFINHLRYEHDFFYYSSRNVSYTFSLGIDPDFYRATLWSLSLENIGKNTARFCGCYFSCSKKRKNKSAEATS